MESKHAQRKNEHLSLATKLYEQVHMNSFDEMQIIHQSLPEISLDQVSTNVTIDGLNLQQPRSNDRW